MSHKHLEHLKDELICNLHITQQYFCAVVLLIYMLIYKFIHLENTSILSGISWIIPVLESSPTGSWGETWITRTISGMLKHCFENSSCEAVCMCLNFKLFSLHGGLGKDGLPGNPGMKVIQACAHSFSVYLNLPMWISCERFSLSQQNVFFNYCRVTRDKKESLDL